MCPWCKAKAIDMTTSDDLESSDPRQRFMCVGVDGHEWRAGDRPEPVHPPLIVLARD